jgi:predicted MFS family arabinose efflux permease
MTLLLSVLLLGLIDVQIFSPILPLLSEDFNISIATAGIAVTAYSITSALWALFIGPLSDRFGRLIFLRLAAGMFATASMLAFFSERFGVYVLARVLAGLAGGSMSACSIALVADLVPYERRGKAMGLVGAMYSVAAVVGVPFGALIAGSFGWRSIYIIFAAPALLLAILMHRTQKAVDGEFVNNGANHHRRASGIFDAVRRQLRDYGRFWMNGGTRHGLLLAVSFSATATSLLTYLGAWLAHDFNMDVELIGVVFLTTGLAALLGAFGGGWMADRLGKRRLIGVSSLALAAVMLTSYFVQNQAQVFAFCIAGAMAIAVREGPYQALITEQVQAYERGAYIAMRNSTSQIAIAATAAIGGVLYEQFGYVAVASFAGACSLLAAVIVYFALEPVSTPTQSIRAPETNEH